MHPSLEQENRKVTRVEELAEDICGLIARSIVITRQNHEEIYKLEEQLNKLNTDAAKEGENLSEYLRWLDDRVKTRMDLIDPKLAEKMRNADRLFDYRATAITEHELLSMEKETDELEEQMLSIDKYTTESAKCLESLDAITDDHKTMIQRQKLIDKMPLRPNIRVGGASHELARVLLRAEEMLYFLKESWEADAATETPPVLEAVAHLRRQAEQASLAKDGSSYRYLANVDCSTGNVVAVRQNLASKTVRVGAESDRSESTSMPTLV